MAKGKPSGLNGNNASLAKGKSSLDGDKGVSFSSGRGERGLSSAAGKYSGREGGGSSRDGSNYSAASSSSSRDGGQYTPRDLMMGVDGSAPYSGLRLLRGDHERYALPSQRMNFQRRRPDRIFDGLSSKVFAEDYVPAIGVDSYTRRNVEGQLRYGEGITPSNEGKDSPQKNATGDYVDRLIGRLFLKPLKPFGIIDAEEEERRRNRALYGGRRAA